MTPPTPELLEQVRVTLARSTLYPSPTWLATLLTTLKPAPPPVLAKTASIRLLLTNFAETLTVPPTLVFPPDILNAEIVERRLGGPIPVQIVGVEEIGKSRMSQIEALEDLERGEGKKGYEVVRVIREEQDPEDTGITKGTCKVLLEDAAGKRVYGFELSPINGLKVGMYMGTKMMLRNIVVARGVLLLEPDTATLLGGKIESLHENWLENRKNDLKAAIGME